MPRNTVLRLSQRNVVERIETAGLSDAAGDRLRPHLAVLGWLQYGKIAYALTKASLIAP